MQNYRNFIFISMIASAMFLASCAKPGPVTEVQASSADPRLSAAEEMIKKMPDSPIGYNQLAASYIKSARRSGDFSLNLKAEAAVNKALELDASDVTARKLRASLQLTFHRFPEALESGNALLKEFPNDAFVYGVLTDANVELGNYKAAAEAVQKMVDIKPNTSSYARVAHVRSLYGDHQGAIEAMTTAARSADPQDKEEQSWCLVQIADELMKNGKYAEANKVYDEALQVMPGYYLGLAGKGRLLGAQGNFEEAVKVLKDAQERVPNIETIILLGDVYKLTGNENGALDQYRLAEAIENAPENTDKRRLALLLADQDRSLDQALEIARAEYEKRKDIYTTDIYAWALYKKGQFGEAGKVAKEAMRLNTNDARILYHAGMIEMALGNKKAGAGLLKKALEINNSFDLIQRDIAKKALADA